MTKTQLLQRLRVKRAEWDALLTSIGEARLTQPGAAGEWSMRDVMAHVTVYEQWLVDWLQSARRGEFPAPSVLDTPGIEERNAAAYAQTRTLSPREVHAEAARTFQALLKVLEQFPDEDFVDPARTEWFMKPYWSTKRTIGEAVLNYTVEHYAEHRLALRTLAEEFIPNRVD